MRLAANQLITVAPTNSLGHYFVGVLAIDDGKMDQGESELLLAEKYGFPKSEIDKILNDSGIRTQHLIASGTQWLGLGFLAWLVGLALLFLVGEVLSSLPLNTVNHAVTSMQSEIGPGERFIRRIYRIIIAISAGYFYISMPVLILLVIAIVGGIIYMFFYIGHIPVQLALFILTAGVLTLYSIVRSVFSRAGQADPGKKVAPAEMPDLWQLTREVANKVGTRPVDAIFLTPGVEVAVTERGRLISKLRDQSERVLILGLGSLTDLTQAQLRSILAHEYGHFNNRDTAGGTIARQVQYSVYMMAANLARSGLARWYNPAWWFIKGYHRIFLRITLGASRLQEILADRVAVFAYGAENFNAGLKTIIREGLVFDLKLGTEIASAKSAKRSLNNLYALPDPIDTASLEQKLATVMSRPSSPYDSHPAPCERLALVERIQVYGYFDEDKHPAWELIPNASKIQKDVTSEIEGQLRYKRLLPAKSIPATAD